MGWIDRLSFTEGGVCIVLVGLNAHTSYQLVRMHARMTMYKSSEIVLRVHIAHVH